MTINLALKHSSSHREVLLLHFTDRKKECVYRPQKSSLKRLSLPLIHPSLFSLTQLPKAGRGLLILDVSKSHNDTPYSVDSSGRVIGLSYTPLPDNTQHSKETDIQTPGRIRTRNPSKRSAADYRLRPLVMKDGLFFIHMGLYLALLQSLTFI